MTGHEFPCKQCPRKGPSPYMGVSSSSSCFFLMVGQGELQHCVWFPFKKDDKQGVPGKRTHPDQNPPTTAFGQYLGFWTWLTMRLLGSSPHPPNLKTHTHTPISPIYHQPKSQNTRHPPLNRVGIPSGIFGATSTKCLAWRCSPPPLHPPSFLYFFGGEGCHGHLESILQPCPKKPNHPKEGGCKIDPVSVHHTGKGRLVFVPCGFPSKKATLMGSEQARAQAAADGWDVESLLRTARLYEQVMGPRRRSDANTSPKLPQN